MEPIGLILRYLSRDNVYKIYEAIKGEKLVFLGQFFHMYCDGLGKSTIQIPLTWG